MADEWDGMERRANLGILEERLSALHSDVKGMRDALSQLTSAITKLALVEERQTQSQQALERAFTAIAKVESAISKLTERITNLEIKAPAHDKASQWVERVSIAAVSTLAMLILAKSGII